MITFTVHNPPTEQKAYKEGFCLSTDTKPSTDLVNGSILVEIDTGTVFFFDEEGGEWVEQFSFQGEDDSNSDAKMSRQIADSVEIDPVDFVRETQEWTDKLGSDASDEPLKLDPVETGGLENEMPTVRE